ncbi:MAG TPA: HD domain-containing protein [Candidatus Binatia bacterium]|nr:HD domain-containing protein [Candidatus Binatia bacterium]
MRKLDMKQDTSRLAEALLKALIFAARKHRDQRRKDAEASPYINHPIEVAEIIARIGGVDDVMVLQAALLHDTVEDTQTSPAELEREFGATVRKLVEEVTDDKTLAKQERKRLQIEHASHLSPHAKLIKLADKICNVRDVTHSPPKDWDERRRVAYLDWAAEVVAGCRGTNRALERHFDALLRQVQGLMNAAGASPRRKPA